jgi:dTDP-L-rhamnose 4-epimerase
VKRILVTGASGFVGRNTLDPLRARGFEVHGAMARGEGLDVRGVVAHCADLLDPHQVRRLFNDVAPSHLLHLAWCTEHGKYWEAPENLDWVAASLTLARAFHDHGGMRMVMAGSCAEYDWAAPNCTVQETNPSLPLGRGRGEGGSRNEKKPRPWGKEVRETSTCIEGVSPCKPATLYGISKHALHTLVSAFCARAGISAAWARIFFLYGPDEDPRRLVASVIRALLSGESAECTHGEQVRDFLHVADAGSALAALVDSGVEGPVNVASGNAVPLSELLHALGKHLGRGDLIRLGAKPAPENDPPILAADTRRLNDEVGWEPTVDLETGLEATISWWRNRLEGCAS